MRWLYRLKQKKYSHQDKETDSTSLKFVFTAKVSRVVREGGNEKGPRGIHGTSSVPYFIRRGTDGKGSQRYLASCLVYPTRFITSGPGVMNLAQQLISPSFLPPSAPQAVVCSTRPCSERPSSRMKKCPPYGKKLQIALRIRTRVRMKSGEQGVEIGS